MSVPYGKRERERECVCVCVCLVSWYATVTGSGCCYGTSIVSGRERERESVCVCETTAIQGICDVLDVTVNVLSSQTVTMTPILPRSYIN